MPSPESLEANLYFFQLLMLFDALAFQLLDACGSWAAGLTTWYSLTPHSTQLQEGALSTDYYRYRLARRDHISLLQPRRRWYVIGVSKHEDEQPSVES